MERIGTGAFMFIFCAKLSFGVVTYIYVYFLKSVQQTETK